MQSGNFDLMLLGIAISQNNEVILFFKAKKRIRWEKRLRNAESVFQKKKAEIDAKIKEYQNEINEVRCIGFDNF